ncbi:MAG: hypothetical protein E7C54_14935, partial [Clostridioides difficile]|nr:hypothetical protein [Clostridioides difficile]
LPQKQNARRADKIRLCGHLRRYKKIVKKTYIIYDKIHVTKNVTNFITNLRVQQAGKRHLNGCFYDIVKMLGLFFEVFEVLFLLPFF